MRKKLFLILITILITILISSHLKAQTKHENSTWFVMANSTKINEKFGLSLDVQLIGVDHLTYLKNFLFRAGFSYHISKQNIIAAGYSQNQTYAQNYALPAANSPQIKNLLHEHQIWEQYVKPQKINSILATHRFRLEQRFIERNGVENLFAQRFRYFLRLVKPLQKKQEAFKKGIFAAVQNEVFFNVQNKEELNGSLFDQNRVYLAAGYRFSPKFDVDAGYVNQVKHGATNNTQNDIVQLIVYTRF